MAVDYEKDVLVVTCASGKQALHLIPHLQGKWKHLRLAVNSQSSENRLRAEYPDAEVVRADMAIRDDATRLLKGASAVFFVGPSLHSKEAECGFNMVDAAVAEANSGDFKHFVYSSVACTQLRKLLNHDCKRYVEEYLIESGLNYTILQPSHFMENTPVAMLLQQDEPVYQTPYNTIVRFSFTALCDMGEAAAVVLEQREQHYFAQYPIISTMPMAYTEFLAILGQVMGKSIRAEQKPLQEAVDGIMKRFFAGKKVDPTSMDVAERLLLYYNRRGILGNPSVLEMLIGKKGTSCQQWAELQLEALKAN